MNNIIKYNRFKLITESSKFDKFKRERDALEMDLDKKIDEYNKIISDMNSKLLNDIEVSMLDLELYLSSKSINTNMNSKYISSYFYISDNKDLFYDLDDLNHKLDNYFGLKYDIQYHIYMKITILNQLQKKD